MARPRFIWKKTCDTCRKYKKQLDAWGVDYDGREINAEPLSADELDALIGARPVKPFLNPRNAVYRERNLKDATPDKATAVALIAEHNNLLKRPVLIVDDAMVIGNDLKAAAALLGEAHLNTPFGQHPLAGRFNALDPAMVAAAVEVDGRRTTGRFVVLNSYENRVYELELDDGSRVVGKFYRPGRWSRDALLDEHDFLLDLEEAEVPVAAPLELDDEGETLGELTGEAAGIHYAVYPKTRGRVPQEFDDDQLVQLGEWLARLHDVGAAGTAEHRPALTPGTYGRANLSFLLENGVLPDAARDGYAFTVEALCDRIEPLFRDVPTHRIHGDCHPGNLLWTPDGPVFLDFDDMLTGPAVQDVWMLVPSYDAEGDRQRQVLLEGYRAERDFPDEWLRLVEPLRALRFVHYAAWIARRWEDPIFQRTFGHFGTVRYWQQETLDLREQLARLDHADL